MYLVTKPPESSQNPLGALSDFGVSSLYRGFMRSSQYGGDLLNTLLFCTKKDRNVDLYVCVKAPLYRGFGEPLNAPSDLVKEPSFCSKKTKMYI